jgi:hypothetical protein
MIMAINLKSLVAQSEAEPFVLPNNADSETLKGVLGDAMYVAYAIVQFTKKNPNAAVTVLLGLFSKYGQNALAILQEAWTQAKNKGEDEFRAIIEGAKVEFDIADDELEEKIEVLVGLPAISFGQVIDVIGQFVLVRDIIKGEGNFLEKLQAFVQNAPAIIDEANDTADLVREWVAVIRDLFGGEGEPGDVPNGSDPKE